MALERVLADLEKKGAPNSSVRGQPQDSSQLSPKWASIPDSGSAPDEVGHMLFKKCADLVEDARLLISEIRRTDAQTAVLNRLAALVSTAAALTEAGPPQALGNEDDVATQRQIDLILQDIQEGIHDAEKVELDSSLPVRTYVVSMQVTGIYLAFASACSICVSEEVQTLFFTWDVGAFIENPGGARRIIGTPCRT